MKQTGIPASGAEAYEGETRNALLPLSVLVVRATLRGCIVKANTSRSTPERSRDIGRHEDVHDSCSGMRWSHLLGVPYSSPCQHLR